MALVAARERELIGRIAPALLRHFGDLVEDWRREWAHWVGVHTAPPDLPEITLTALQGGVDEALDRQKALAARLVADSVPLDLVVRAVLLWDDAVRRKLAGGALDDILSGGAALSRLHHGLVLLVAERHSGAMEDAWTQVRQGLEDADRLKDDLVSMISHDLKTPLTTIQGCAVSMLQMPELSEDQRHRFLEKILQNAERLSRLISQILDISRIHARALDLHIQSVDPSTLVGRLADGILQTAPLVVDVPAATPPVLADTGALERILVNLLDNAFKYTPEGEAVRVEASDQNGMVEFRVADRGPGIPESRRAGLFSRFYQVDPSPSGRRTGTGLGLAIVRGLAEAMGGAAGFTPNHDRGSIFWVRLPAQASE